MIESAVSQPRRALRATGPLLLPLAAGAACVVVGSLVPWLNPMLVALILGVIAANVGWGTSAALGGHARWTKFALRLGIVVFGLRLPFGEVVALGWQGIAVIVLTVAVTYAVTIVVGDRLGLERGLVTLIAAGFAVCGAAAIAAVQDTVKAPKEAVATALALVTIFGSILIGVVPLAAAALGLSERQAGMWAGASIHEVAQVVAAASLTGTVALAAATTVKLGRVALLAVVHLAAARRAPRDRAVDARRPAILPWFIVGFVVCVAIRSTGILPDTVVDVSSMVTNVLLATGMFGLGLGIRLSSLLPVPWRAVGLSAVATVVALGVSLPLTALAA